MAGLHLLIYAEFGSKITNSFGITLAICEQLVETQSKKFNYLNQV